MGWGKDQTGKQGQQGGGTLRREARRGSPPTLGRITPTMHEATYSSAAPTDSLVRRKRLILVAMVALTCFFAVLDSVFMSVRGWERSSFLHAFSFAFCLVVWCSADATLHDFRFGWGFRWCIFLFTVIAFPIYAFKSCGRGGWRLLGLGFLFFSALLAVSFTVEWVTDLLMEHYGSGANHAA